MLRVGGTACEASVWLSASSVTCRVAQGAGGYLLLTELTKPLLLLTKVTKPLLRLSRAASRKGRAVTSVSFLSKLNLN